MREEVDRCEPGQHFNIKNQDESWEQKNQWNMIYLHRVGIQHSIEKQRDQISHMSITKCPPFQHRTTKRDDRARASSSPKPSAANSFF